MPSRLSLTSGFILVLFFHAPGRADDSRFGDLDFTRLSKPREQFLGSASLSVLVGLIGRLADKRACERTWIGLPGRTCGFLGSGETAIVG
jgi:hypothetical protein